MNVELSSFQRNGFNELCTNMMDTFYFCPGINERCGDDFHTGVKFLYAFSRNFLKLFNRYEGNYYGEGMTFELHELLKMEEIKELLETREYNDDWKRACSDDYWDEISWIT